MTQHTRSSRLTLRSALEMFPEMEQELPRIRNERLQELQALERSMARFAKLYASVVKQMMDDKNYAAALWLEKFWATSDMHFERERLHKHINELTAVMMNEGLTNGEIQQAHDTPVAGFLTSKKHGKHYVCPFHNEKTPSLHVTGNKWYCFGCNKGGDTISFVMNLRGLNFKEAVRYINAL